MAQCDPPPSHYASSASDSKKSVVGPGADSSGLIRPHHTQAQNAQFVVFQSVAVSIGSIACSAANGAALANRKVTHHLSFTSPNSVPPGWIARFAGALAQWRGDPPVGEGLLRASTGSLPGLTDWVAWNLLPVTGETHETDPTDGGPCLGRNVRLCVFDTANPGAANRI